MYCPIKVRPVAEKLLEWFLPTEVKVFMYNPWKYSPTSGHNHVGSGAPGSQKHPVPAGLGRHGCDLKLFIEVGEGLVSLAAGSGGDQNTSWFFPSIHGMRYTFYLTHLPVSTPSINVIHLFPTASFHPSLLPTFPDQCQMPLGWVSCQQSLAASLSPSHCHSKQNMVPIPCSASNWDTGNDFAEQETF